MIFNAMCLAPILIKNYDYHSPVKDDFYSITHNTKDSYIAVPCGRCAACIRLKQIYLVQRVQMEAINHDLFYGTLTYNQDSLPIAKYGDIEFAYADFSDWQRMVKMIRKYYPDLKFKYLLVSEFGGRKKRPHFHFILSLPKTTDDIALKVSKAYELFNIFLSYWRRNYGSTRNPIWKPLCTYVRKPNSYNYDLHWLDPNSSKDGIDGVSFYVTKYILKYDDWIDKFKSKLFYSLSDSDFKKAWDKFKPRCLLSKGFGSPDDLDVRNHIYKGINLALNTIDAFFPFYISRQNGQTFPLAPYYSRRFLDLNSLIVFKSRCPDLKEITSDDIHKFDTSEIKFQQTKQFLSQQTSLFDLDDIDNINYLNSIDNGKFLEITQSDKEFADYWQDFDNSDYCDG